MSHSSCQSRRDVTLQCRCRQKGGSSGIGPTSQAEQLVPIRGKQRHSASRERENRPGTPVCRGWPRSCIRCIRQALQMSRAIRRRRVRVAMVAGVCWLVSNTALAALCPCPGAEAPHWAKTRSSDGPGVHGEGGGSEEAPCHSVPKPEHPSQPQEPCPAHGCCSTVRSPVEITSPVSSGPIVTVSPGPAGVTGGSRFPVRSGEVRSQHLLVHDPPSYIRHSALLI